jgi:hypothetical protein
MARACRNSLLQPSTPPFLAQYGYTTERIIHEGNPGQAHIGHHVFEVLVPHVVGSFA